MNTLYRNSTKLNNKLYNLLMPTDGQEFGRDTLKQITHAKKIIDLSFLPPHLSTEDNFRNETQKLCISKNLPSVFPYLPDYLKARVDGFVTNYEFKDAELTLPKELYDSETYKNNLELRGPLEEIILAYEAERTRLGLPTKTILGNDWSEVFKKRLEKMHKLPISIREIKDEQDEKDKFSDPFPSGGKIA
jgi:hypothetical protein